ncbi:MAG: DUF1415 domain-containing protein [Sulfuriferula sp.]|nr:DUF1415 domain-containing protein [Sulfuriferula sp.]
MINRDAVIADTQHWLEQAVIGLNLCPFAKAVHVKQQIRYVVSSAKTEATLLDDLLQEMDFLMAADSAEVDTTLLIHPLVLTDFLDYNDFLDVADGATAEPEFDNALQIASFHPQYQFADTDVDDIENYTNRSPYPMLHILREDSIARAVAAFPEASDIYANNMATLRKLGLAGWQRLLAK